MGAAADVTTTSCSRVLNAATLEETTNCNDEGLREMAINTIDMAATDDVCLI